MSELDKIKKKLKEPEVWLEGVNFDFDKSDDSPLGGHIHFVTQSASGKDTPLLLKSENKTPTKEELEILKKVMKDKTEEKTKDDDMDEKVLKEKEDRIEELEKELALKEKENVIKSVEALNLEEELSDELVEVLIKIDDNDKAVILKAITPIKKEKNDDNEALKKQLDNEEGHDAEVEVKEKLTFKEEIAKAIAGKEKK